MVLPVRVKGIVTVGSVTMTSVSTGINPVGGKMSHAFSRAIYYRPIQQFI